MSDFLNLFYYIILAMIPVIILLSLLEKKKKKKNIYFDKPEKLDRLDRPKN